MDSTAVMGRRIGAYIIDAILGIIVSVIAFLVAAESIETAVDPCGFDDSPTLCLFVDGTTYFADGGRAVAVFATSFGFWLLMGWIIQGATGGTPGKLILGLRVVDQKTGNLAGLGKCLVRTLMWIVDAQPFGLPLVGLITGVASKGHRRVGDMVASTFVVNKASVGQPPVVPGLTAPATVTAGAPGPGQFAPSPPDEQVDTGDCINAPKWDAERGAYIQWDKENQAWMIYDEAASQWRPLT